jgi:succinoglycan biosynthesis protein ExoA
VKPPFVTVVVPTLNEAEHVEACLRSLLGQWPADRCEVLVVDGGSTDGTPALVEHFARAHPAPTQPPIRVLANANRLQSAGVNLAAWSCSPQASVLVRADAHATYPADFIGRVVTDLHRTGASSVVVALRTTAEPGRHVQRAIATAQSSLLGNGGSVHRRTPQAGPVDHGHHAAFDLAWFRSLGGYDPTFSHNEDAEFDHRSRAAGGTVWMSPVAVDYRPRAGLAALARQYARHGAGRARTLRRHRTRPQPRQLAPVLLLAGYLGAAAVARVAPRVAIAGAASYPSVLAAWALSTAAQRRDPWLLLGAPALAVMHLSWAAGFLVAVPRPVDPTREALT